MKIRALIAVLAASAIAVPVAQAKPYTPVIQLTPGHWTVNMVEDFGQVTSRVIFSSDVVPYAPGYHRQYLCTEIGKTPCEFRPPKAGESWVADGVFVIPPCAEAQDGPCLESVDVINGGVPVAATLIRSVDNPAFSAQPDIGLPAGGSTSLWRSTTPVGADGTALLSVYAKLGINVDMLARQISFASLRVDVAPYHQVEGDYDRAEAFQDYLPDGRPIVSGRANLNCIWQETGRCGIPEDFQTDVTYRVSLRVPDTVTGWLMGRLRDPLVSVTPLSNGLNRLIVEASPVRVPRMTAVIPIDRVPEGLKPMAPDFSRFNGQISGVGVNDDQSFVWFKELMPFANDRAAGENTAWSFASVEGGRGSNCLNSTQQLLGLVTTNAMVYSGRAPDFKDGFLEYQVAGTHYDSKGELFKGSYDLIIDSKAARCIYGFSSAPISATVSVTYADKAASVATTVVSEKDGWLKLAAYDFTFSSPMVKVAITQEKPLPTATPTPTPTPTAKPTVVAAPKKTISCTKGGVTKRVSGAKPKCPHGWRLKK